MTNRGSRGESRAGIAGVRREVIAFPKHPSFSRRAAGVPRKLGMTKRKEAAANGGASSRFCGVQTHFKAVDRNGNQTG